MSAASAARRMLRCARALGGGGGGGGVRGISTISSRDVGAGVRLGEVVFGIVEMMFAFYRHQVVVLEFFSIIAGEKRW